MDPIKIEKIRAINKCKRYHQLVDLFLFSLTALTCSLIFSSPFWFPSFSTSMKVFLFESLPKIGSLFFSYKFVFIIGNLIVVVLIGESKIFSSKIFSSKPFSAGDDIYDEYINSCTTPSIQSNSIFTEVKGVEKMLEFVEENVKTRGEEIMEGKGVEEEEDLDGNNHEFSFPVEELNKMADDFIAMVNEKRRLEARLNYL